jgi:hypothetical protein
MQEVLDLVYDRQMRELLDCKVGAMADTMNPMHVGADRIL